MSSENIKKQKQKTKSDQTEKNPVNVLFGKKLAELRKMKGLQQDECAKKLNVHPQTISRYERGEISPSLSFMVEASKFFNVSIDWFTLESEDAVESTKIPLLGKSSYMLVDKQTLEQLTGNDDLSALVVDNNNMLPTLQKDDIVLVTKNVEYAIDQIVVIKHQSKYVIKRISKIAGKSIDVTSDGIVNTITINIQDIVGIVKAYLRGNL